MEQTADRYRTDTDTDTVDRCRWSTLLAFYLFARLLKLPLRLESGGTPNSFHFHPKINLTASCVRKWMRVVQERMIFQRTTRLTTAAAAAGGAAAAAVAAAVAASRVVAVYLDLTFGLVS